MYKPRIVFPFVYSSENSTDLLVRVAEKFDIKYGKSCVVIKSDLYCSKDKKSLAGFGARVKNGNEPRLFLSSKLKRQAIEAYEEIRPDLVVSTHWSTDYFAKKLDKKPLTVVIAVDGLQPSVLRSVSDMLIVTEQSSYAKAVKSRRCSINGVTLLKSRQEESGEIQTDLDEQIADVLWEVLTKNFPNLALIDEEEKIHKEENKKEEAPTKKKKGKKNKADDRQISFLN